MLLLFLIAYARKAGTLASTKEAWVYVHAPARVA